MKTIQVILIGGIAIAIAACKSSKNNSTSSTTTASTPTSASSPTTNSTEPVSPFYMTKSANGIYAPGNEELSAIQVQYPDVTLDKLNKGYSLYAESACLQCHPAKNIYRIDEQGWKELCEDMSKKAMISDEQKDAVYKYVLAVKASKAKSER